MRIARLLLLLVFAGGATSCASTTGGSLGAEEAVRVVRPGVVHRSIRDPQGPWSIQVLEVDLLQGDLFFDTAHGQDSLFGRETTSSMARRLSDSTSVVVAALNGDFFDLTTGESVNNQVAAGIFVRALVPVVTRSGEPRNVRSQIAFPLHGKPQLDRFVFDGRIFWRGGATSTIGGVNAIRARTDLVLLNSYYGWLPPEDSVRAGRVGLPLRVVASAADTLVAIAGSPIPGPAGLRVTNDGPILLSLPRAGLFGSVGVVAGDTVRLYLGFRPPAGPLRGLVGGIPRIVRNGETFSAIPELLEGATEAFANNRHPRSGIGFSRDSTRVFLVTVDGRQPGSDGMTLQEFSSLMISLGAAEALNLDGGGSTTMVIGGRVVNSPSDAAGERPVANAILLKERRKR